MYRGRYGGVAPICSAESTHLPCRRRWRVDDARGAPSRDGVTLRRRAFCGWDSGAGPECPGVSADTCERARSALTAAWWPASRWLNDPLTSSARWRQAPIGDSPVGKRARLPDAWAEVQEDLRASHATAGSFTGRGLPHAAAAQCHPGNSAVARVNRGPSTTPAGSARPAVRPPTRGDTRCRS
jgi:hypothetical protein